MDMTILVQMGMAVGAVGFFVASYYRFSRPTRVNSHGNRQAPQISAPSSAAVAETGGTRRSPSL